MTDEIKELISAFLIIVRLGVGLRIIHCAIKAMGQEDQTLYKNRAINTLKYYISAELIWQFVAVLRFYYKFK